MWLVAIALGRVNSEGRGCAVQKGDVESGVEDGGCFGGVVGEPAEPTGDETQHIPGEADALPTSG